MSGPKELRALVEALKPFAHIGGIIDELFFPTIFRDGEDAFQSGCSWTENGERKTLTWGDFRRARTALTRSESSLASPAGMEGWMPIETAPKDGTRLLLWSENWSAPHTGQFYGEKWGTVWEVGPFKFQPTHWMPLPAAPRGETE